MKKVGFSLVIILGMLFLLEGFSRLLLSKLYNRDFDSSLIIENKYGTSSGLKPSAKGKVWGQQFTTDKFGGRASGVPLNSNKKKWLFIGDSVTEGVGVDDESTFASRHARDFLNYDVLNISLIGYSVTDYYNVLNHWLENDTSVELVTLFFCLNDVYGPVKSTDLPAIGRQDMTGKVSSFLQKNYNTYKLLKLLVFRFNDRYFQYDLQFYQPEHLYFLNSVNALKVCQELCNQRGVFFQVVMMPYQSQLRSENLNVLQPQKLLGAYCLTNEIEFSDAYDYLKNRTNVDELYLFGDEIHFSEKGHAAMAGFLSE